MFLASLRPHWPVFAFLVSASLLAGAHGFERFLGLAPCELCLQQREAHWAVLALAVACFAALRFRPGLARAAAGLLGLGFLASAGMALYHVAVEQGWVIHQCESGSLDAIQVLGEGPIAMPACDVVAWSWLGLSMAGWNAAVSLLMALDSFVVALAPAAKADA